MGFNRRKMEDQRREAAEKEAAGACTTLSLTSAIAVKSDSVSLAMSLCRRSQGQPSKASTVVAE
jgi:hypothetical protein